jgi:subtilisin family serine protease
MFSMRSLGCARVAGKRRVGLTKPCRARRLGLESRKLALEKLEDRQLLSISGLDDDNAARVVNFADQPAPTADVNGAAEIQKAAVGTPPFAPGEILVGFEGDVVAAYRNRGAAVALEAAGKLVGANGLHTPEVLMDLPAAAGHAARLATRWRLPDGADVLQTVQQLTGRPGIAYVEPNYALSIDATPNDPRFSELWGLNNTGQTGGTFDADIDAPEAWDITTGSSTVVVGVIDTGVDYNHPDLAANIWTNPGEVPGNGLDDDGNGYIDDIHGYDFVNNDGNPFDDNGHGTHTSGTIGAVGNNGIGVVGVNWNVQIMALKFLDAGGGGWTDDAVAAVKYATMMHDLYVTSGGTKGANIVLTSNSWGGGGYSQALYDAINDSGNADMLFVASAGNSNSSSPSYPAGYDLANIISVAATDHKDARASFSNYGADWVDLGAPGVAILSTTPNNTYSVYDGTSMAAPHVSGAAALAWSTSPQANYQTIRDAIFAGVDKIPALDPAMGSTTPVATGGRLNAFNTLKQLAMAVTGSTPAAGEVVFSKPTDFVIRFSFPVDGSTLQPGDLTVNGSPANDVILSGDGKTATFDYGTTPVTAEGVQTMSMETGAVRTTSTIPGDPLLRAWTANFRYDAVLMKVDSTEPANGSTVALPMTTLKVTFNEAYAKASADSSDLVLSQGYVQAFNKDDPLSVVYTLAGIVREQPLTVKIPAGALTDVYDNPMAAYSGSFTLDFGTAPLPGQFDPAQPLGSLVHQAAVSAFIAVPNDTDSFTFAVDPGQTISVVVDPAATLRPTVTLTSPGVGTTTVSAVGAGKDAVIQPVGPTTAGTYTYTITVGSVGGGSTGAYTLQVILNAAVEEESHDGTPNNLTGTAQSIDSSFIALAEGAQRGAVCGAMYAPFTNPRLLDGFENGNLKAYTEKGTSNTSITTSPVHDGNYALKDETNGGLLGWIVRTDTQASVSRGQVISAWVCSESGTDWSRAYVGFGAVAKGSPTTQGAISLVMGVNTGQLLINRVSPWDTYTVLGAVPQSWLANHWYRMEVTWQTDGNIIGRLFDSDGTTLLNSVRGQDTKFTSGGIAFRAFGSTKYFDTIQAASIVLDPDVYKFTLGASQRATLALKASGGNAHLELLNSSGTKLADGSTGATNVSEVIEFAGGAGGTYYARITGELYVQYELVVTQGAKFDVEPNSGPQPWDGDPAQTVELASAGDSALAAFVLGHVRGGGPQAVANPKVLYYMDYGFSNPFSQAMSNLGITPTVATSYTDFATKLQAGGWDIAVLLDQDYGNSEWVAPMVGFVNSGGRAIACDWYQNTTAAAAFGAQYTGNIDGDPITQISHPIWDGIADPFDLNLIWPVSSMGMTATTGTSIGTFPNGDDALIVGNGGHTVLNGFLSDTAQNPEEGVKIAENEITFLGASEVDFYKVTVPSATGPRYFELTTATPADGPGEFVNTLNPKLRLFDSAGTALAVDDDSGEGANALLYYAIPDTGGTYYVEVLASDALDAAPSAGEYLLRVDVKEGLVPVDGITVSKTSVTTTEAGGKDTFTLVLNTDPGGGVSVTIPLHSDNTAEGTISPASVTFTGGTGGNWNVPQTITVKGVDDFVDDGDIAYTIVTESATVTGGSSAYAGMDAADVAAINLDNDTAGITVTLGNSVISGMLVTYEASNKDPATFTVKLNSQPTDDVMITVSSSNTSEGRVSPQTLIFSPPKGNVPGNWDQPQTVTVTGVDDAPPLDDGNVTYTIALTPSSTGDANYRPPPNGTVPPATVSAININNDADTSLRLRLVDDFEDGNLVEYTENGTTGTSVTLVAARDGMNGLQDNTDGGWLIRTDTQAQVKRGDIISVWVRSDGDPSGRAYLGFGVTTKGKPSGQGCLSIVMAPNTNQLLIQRNVQFGYADIGSVAQTWVANKWYRMEVQWKTTGEIVGRLYDGDGTHLLNTVTATDTTFSAGGIAFRAFDSTKDFDTVELRKGLPPGVTGAANLAAGVSPSAALADAALLDGAVSGPSRQQLALAALLQYEDQLQSHKPDDKQSSAIPAIDLALLDLAI